MARGYLSWILFKGPFINYVIQRGGGGLAWHKRLYIKSAEVEGVSKIMLFNS